MSLSKTRLKFLRLQARAYRRHGISRADFLLLTPSQLRLLDEDARKEWLLEKEIEDRRTARLMAAIYNCSAAKRKGKVFTEDDFLPKNGEEVKQSSSNESAINLLAKVQWVQNRLEVADKLNKQ